MQILCMGTISNPSCDRRRMKLNGLNPVLVQAEKPAAIHCGQTDLHVKLVTNKHGKTDTCTYHTGSFILFPQFRS